MKKSNIKATLLIQQNTLRQELFKTALPKNKAVFIYSIIANHPVYIS